MPQPKKSSSSGGSRRSSSSGGSSRSGSSRSGGTGRSSSGRSSSARSTSSSSSRTSSSGSSSRGSSARSPSPKRAASGARSPGARKGGAGTQPKRSASSTKGAAGTAAARSEEAAQADVAAVEQGLAALRSALTARAMDSLNVVMVTRERMQEAFDDAVSRGHMTQQTANALTADMVKRTRREARDIISDMEQLVGRAGLSLEQAGKRVRQAPGTDRALREVDRARRVVGVGPSFPVLGYDDLTAAQISGRLDDLSPAELRKVRDYERRHGNRKSVLAAIERKLA